MAKIIYLTNSPLLVLVSDEDYLEFALQTWCLINGYARATARPREFMHKIIGKRLGIKSPDHKDRNKLNNERTNFREATRSQNNINQGKQSNTTSQYKGVHWHIQNQKWIASITINYKAIYLGSFKLEKDAAKAYNKAALKYFGEFAVLNEV